MCRMTVKETARERHIQEMANKSILRYYKVKEDCEMEEYLSDNRKYKYECFCHTNRAGSG